MNLFFETQIYTLIWKPIPEFDVLKSMWWGPECFPVIRSDTLF